MPFWTHGKYLLVFISYLPMWIKAKYTFIKTVYSSRYYGGPYMQAKHADICCGVLFWTACTRRPPKSHERYHNAVMWHWIVYKWRRSKQRLSFHRTFFNLLIFTVSLSCRQGLTFWDSAVTLFKSAKWFVLSGTGFLVAHQLLEMWCANAKLANEVPTSHVKTLVIRMSWSDRRCFEWQER